MGLQRIPLQKFGGLNTTVPGYDSNGDSPDAYDVTPIVLDTTEGLRSRGGPLNISSGGSTPATAITEMMAADVTDAMIVGADVGNQLWTAALGQADPASAAGWTSRLAASGSEGYWFVAECLDPSVVDGLGQNRLFCGHSTPTPVPQVIRPHGVVSNIAFAMSGAYVPGQFQGLVYWRGRLVTADPGNRLWYSDKGDPHAWNNFIDIFDDWNSHNVDLVVHNNNLYLFKQNSIWLISDPNSFASRKIASVGIMEPYNAVSSPYDNRLYFFNRSTGHLYSTNGETDLIVENIDTRPESPNPQIAIAGSTSRYSRVTYNPDNKSILVSYSRSSTAQWDRVDEMFMVGLPTAAAGDNGRITPGHRPVYRHRLNHTAPVYLKPRANETGRGSKVLCAGSTSRARIYDMFGGTTDDGTRIAAYWNSPWMPLQGEELWERVRRLNLIYRGEMIVQVQSAMDPGNAPVIWTPTIPFFSTNEPNRSFFQMKNPSPAKGRYHRIQFTSGPTAGRDWALSAAELAYRGGKDKR